MSESKRPATNPAFKHSRYPTIAVGRYQEAHILEAVHSIFIKQTLASVDLDALVYLTMKQLNVDLATYHDMQLRIRRAILKHYAVAQGPFIPPSERGVLRRIIVCFTVESGKE